MIGIWRYKDWIKLSENQIILCPGYPTEGKMVYHLLPQYKIRLKDRIGLCLTSESGSPTRDSYLCI